MISRILLVCILSTFFIGSVHSQSVRISSDVEANFQLNEIIPVIIELNDQWKPSFDIKKLTKEDKGQIVFNGLKAFALNSQKGLISYMNSEVIQYRSFYIFNGVFAEVNREQLDYILKYFNVKSVAFNKSVPLGLPRDFDKNTGSRMPIEWGIEKIKANLVWEDGFEGQGVTVAGQDTGYDFENSLIVDRYRGSSDTGFEHDYNWHDAIHELNPLHDDPDDNPDNNPCGLDSPIPCDDNSHGSHTMGTMVGQDEENGIGVAPKADWIACRNMDRGWGMPSTYTECFEWFLAPTDIAGMNPDPSKSPHVIANSWGCPEVEGCNEDNWMFMEIVVDNLVAAGVVVVASAGNDGSAGCNSINRPPSMFESSFVVGASNDVDTLAGFSSLGTVTIDGTDRMKPDVVAPGVGVRSITLNDGFGSWSGTSMSGPHVAGAVALVISANPSLAGQVEEIEDILRTTAVQLSDDKECGMHSAQDIPNFMYGHGRIDVYEAVQTALLFSSVEEEVIVDMASIYPNPNEGSFIIRFNNTIEGELELFNVHGQKVYSSKINGSAKLIETALQTGNYFYQVETSKGKTSGKLVVVK